MAWPPWIWDETRLGVGKNLGPPQRDFHNVLKVVRVNAPIMGVFMVILGLYWGPLGHGYAAWPPWIFMRLHKTRDWVW